MGENYTQIRNAIAEYLKAWSKLKDLKVLNTKKDFTSQLSEFIVATLYDGKPSTSSIQKDWDVQLFDGKKIQVKSHAKATTNKNRWTAVPYSEDADIDLYIIVVFTEDYKLKHFFVTTWMELWQLSDEDKTRRLVRWNKLERFDKSKDQVFRNKDLIKLFI